MVQDQQEGLGGVGLNSASIKAKMPGSKVLTEQFKTHLRQV